MRAAIILFSPSGHTLKVGKVLKERLENSEIEVQLLDITRQQIDIDEKIEQHDILFIGAPVYAGHFENNGLKLIDSLPTPNNKWSKFAIPFVTYGGVHSSIALEEAGSYLKRSGRINLMGFKVSTFHTLTRDFDNKINWGLPDNKQLEVIDEVIKEIKKVNFSNVKDVSNTFKYSKIFERIVFKSFSQDFFHKKNRLNNIDHNRCKSCNLCVKKCPTGAIKIDNNKLYISSHLCILCGECYYNCKEQAVDFPYLKKVNKRFKNGVKMEEPQSALYIR